MRTNNERQNYYNVEDVYADIGTSYSSTANNDADAQEFSLQTIQEKLGMFSDLENESGEITNADMMPTEQTLTMNYQRNYSSNVAVTKKISTKAKVAAICYTAVVLVLIVGIALTSVAVTGAFGQTTKLSADYASVLDDLAVLDAQLANEDVNMLAEKATELGYVDASQSNTQTYTEVETRPVQNFNVKTNWFDKLCDWLSGVFGG